MAHKMSDDLSTLKQMLMSFRVSELQILLGFAGRNKIGKKLELTTRALALIQNGCPLPLQIKIKELYRGIGASSSNSMISMLPPSPMVPVNPDVNLIHLPFYDVLGELHKPSNLIPKSNGRIQDVVFVFHLTPQQAQDIATSRDFRPGSKCEYTVQVQLRFCLVENNALPQPDTFPSQIQVRVNNKPATLPNVIPTNKPNVEPKRPGRPVDITNICKLSPTVPNVIQITWAADFTRNFCMSVFLVRKLTSDILLQRLRQYGHRHPDRTKALIKEQLTADQDSEIATTSLKVSLNCPLGKTRMQVPCRASTCGHLQCFDAHTFLLMNERKPTWMCPVCNKQCPYDKLFIDGYVLEIFKANPSTTDIVFHEDGSWSPMKPQKENSDQVVLSTNNKPTTIPSSPFNEPSISLSDSVELETSTPSTSSQPSKAPVIDLTLDSSDDDDDDDALLQSEPTKSPPIINLDSPSPTPVCLTPASPPVLPSYSQSSPPKNGGSHSSSHPESPSSFISKESSPNGGTANQSPTSALQSQALNLEAMSDADFDDFLKGLSWGV